MILALAVLAYLANLAFVVVGYITPVLMQGAGTTATPHRNQLGQWISNFVTWVQANGQNTLLALLGAVIIGGAVASAAGHYQWYDRFASARGNVIWGLVILVAIGWILAVIAESLP